MPFFKIDNGELRQASNFVATPSFELREETHAEYDYPVDGWYWFESLNAAMRQLVEKSPVDEKKLQGIEFEGVMCSATKEDQDGLVAVFLAFQMQGSHFKPTVYEFANGNRLRITAENIQRFIGTWMPFRQSFFSDEGDV